MTPEAFLTSLRRAGVVLTVHGERLAYDAPVAAMGPETDARLRRQKAALISLVRSAWWPDDRPRPSLLSLCNEHGSDAVKAALAGLGCDFAHRNPTWEELFVVSQTLARSTAEVQP